jgi:hypothetical protein
LKIASPQSSLTQEEKTLKALQSQRENLDARLRAEGIDPDTLGGEFDNRNLVEKALNLTPDQGFLMDFFEVIDRPVQAVKQAILAGTEGESVLKGFWEGVSGQEEVTGADFVSQITGGYKPASGVGEFLLNIGTDIALDPLTYLPAGFFIKRFSALGKIGAKEVTEEVVQAAVKSVAQEAADKFVKDTVKAAQALVDDAASSINNLEDGIREVLKKEMTSNVRNIYLFDEAYDSVDDIVDAVKSGKIKQPLLEKRIKQMEDLFSGAYKPTGAAASEAEFYRKIYKQIEKLDPNIKVILNKSSDRFDDVAIFYKTQINGKTSLVKVDGIEVKRMLDVGKKGTKSSPAFFSNIVMNASADGKTIVFGAKSSLSARVQNIMKSTFADISIKVGNKTMSLEEAIATASKAFKAGDTATKNTYAKAIKNFFKTADDASKVKLATMFKEISESSRIGFTFIDNGTGGKLIDVADNLDLFDEVFDVMFETKNNFQMRFRTGFNIRAGANFDAVPNQINNLLERFVQRPGGTEEVTRIWTLARRAREGEFGRIAQAVSKAYKKVETTLKTNLNLYSGFDKETQKLIKRAMGENLFELERRSARLSEIKQALIKIDPEAGELLGEIIEAGAKLTPDGRIIKLKRRMGMSDFLDYVLKRTQDGAEILLPKFPNEAAKKNFLQTLNKLYQDSASAADDLFEVVEKGGGTALKFDGDSTTIKDIIKYFNDSELINRQVPDYVLFGERALSKKAQAFLKANAGQIDEYKNLSDEIVQELVDVAGFENLPKELMDQIGYMRHMMTQEAYKGLQRQLPEVASIFAKRGSDTLRKRTFIGSAQEVNAGLREFMGLDIDLFDPNAFNAMEDLIKVAQRKLDQYRVLDVILKSKGVNGEDLLRVVDNTRDAVKNLKTDYDVVFKSFQEEFPALYKNLSPSGKQRLDEFFKAAGASDKTAVMMNKSAHSVLKGAEKAYVDLPEFVKLYDKFLNTWKGVTLVTPGFHMRNLFGNMFNSYAVGMDLASQSKYLTTAVTELDEFQKIGKKLAQGLDITPQEQEIFDLVKNYFENGTSQTHRGIRDLEQLKSTIDVNAAGKIKSGYNKALRFNFNVAEKMDDVQRYALYRWSLDKTGDAAKASQKVAEALFDYSALTPFEKDYMKRLFPFYTFMKNNFVFQAKNIFANPKQYARVGRAYNYAIEDLAGYDPDNLPDYATENMWLPIPMTVNKNDKKAIAFLKATLPLSDFTELVENPFRKGVVSITAPVKLLIEFGAGRDMFTGAPLTSFPGETNAMEEGTGVLAGLRDRRGNLTITQSPIAQKILNDIGLRTPINLASTGVDIIDTLAGYQGAPENLGDFMARMGLVGIQEVEKIDLTTLYQDLEKLRELKKYYEQETGNQLPVLP